MFTLTERQADFVLGLAAGMLVVWTLLTVLDVLNLLVC